MSSQPKQVAVHIQRLASTLRASWTRKRDKLQSLLPWRRKPTQCPTCALDLSHSESYKKLGVCERCAHHFPITARQRIELLADARSFDEADKKLAIRQLKSVSIEETYPQKLKEAQRETHLQEAVVTGYAEIEAQPCVLCVLDFRFMGGTMGSTVGEKIALAFERAADDQLPIVVVTSSGGARIQEGMFALMQMAKTSAAAQRLQQKDLPYITILTHPTTGGVYASFANLADIILAEPRALIGFAGPRVVEALTRQKLPPDSHRAEFLFEHGMVDAIVSRAQQRAFIGRVLRLLMKPREERNPAAAQGAIKLVNASPQPPRRAWDIVNLARHVERPTSQDYIQRLFTDFIELHGDRLFGDDPAIIGGLARFEQQAVMVIGQERGHGEEKALRRNGSAIPEGYRKAWRLMRLATKFHLPVITFVDTPGADPSYEAEKRGVAMALSQSIGAMTQLATPTVACVIGEGGSGGALALAVADRVLMQENAIYSVISPEGASAILYGDASRAEEVSRILRLTAHDLKELGIIDEVVPEPLDGAHLDAAAAAQFIWHALTRALNEIVTQSVPNLLEARYQKYRRMGREAPKRVKREA
jgi:acetyl-CoA carboxylase carboxyl transferase subunit beta